VGSGGSPCPKRQISISYVSPSNTLPYIHYYYYYYCVLPLTDYKLSVIDAVRRPMLEKLRSNPAQSMPVSQQSIMSPYRYTALPTNSNFHQESPPPPITSLYKRHLNSFSNVQSVPHSKQVPSSFQRPFI
jgi:hypothetical protein